MTSLSHEHAFNFGINFEYVLQGHINKGYIIQIDNALNMIKGVLLDMSFYI